MADVFRSTDSRVTDHVTDTINGGSSKVKNTALTVL